jgi:DnaJ family protein B protein 11
VSLPIAPGTACDELIQLRIRGVGRVELELEQAPHRVFRREGDDLHCSLKLSLYEALVGGFRRAIKLLDGSTVWIAAPSDDEVTVPGQVRRLQGKGMPSARSASKGDLLIHFNVRFPQQPLSAESAKVLKQILPRSAATESPVPIRADQRIHRLIDVRTKI